MSQASLAMNGDEWAKGLISLDAADKLWLAWGHTLVKYDPVADSTVSWLLPAIGQTTSPTTTVDQGRAVSMHVASNSEVWIATQGIEVLFGFNPGTTRWDRQIPIPIVPGKASRITEPIPGQLLLNGFAPSMGPSQAERLIDIDVGKGTSNDRNLAAKDYVLQAADQVIYVDHSNAVKTGTVSLGSSSPLTGPLPAANSPDLVSDTQGQTWFNMLGYRLVGIGRIDDSTGAVMTFPFPYIDQPGTRLPSTSECPVQPGCVPSSHVFDPEVQSLSIDDHNNVWVFTRVSGGVSSLSAPSGVYELTTGA